MRRLRMTPPVPPGRRPRTRRSPGRSTLCRGVESRRRGHDSLPLVRAHRRETCVVGAAALPSSGTGRGHCPVACNCRDNCADCLRSERNCVARMAWALACELCQERSPQGDDQRQRIIIVDERGTMVSEASKMASPWPASCRPACGGRPPAIVASRLPRRPWTVMSSHEYGRTGVCCRASIGTSYTGTGPDWGQEW